jgi:hypothetical protein
MKEQKKNQKPTIEESEIKTEDGRTFLLVKKQTPLEWFCEVFMVSMAFTSAAILGVAVGFLVMK